MKRSADSLLPDELINHGMCALRDWCKSHPNPEAPIIGDLGGVYWSPRSILETLEKRINKGELGYNDFPELVLRSISKSRRNPQGLFGYPSL